MVSCGIGDGYRFILALTGLFSDIKVPSDEQIKRTVLRPVYLRTRRELSASSPLSTKPSSPVRDPGNSRTCQRYFVRQIYRHPRLT